KRSSQYILPGGGFRRWLGPGLGCGLGSGLGSGLGGWIERGLRRLLLRCFFLLHQFYLWCLLGFRLLFGRERFHFVVDRCLDDIHQVLDLEGWFNAIGFPVVLVAVFINMHATIDKLLDL